MIQKCTNQLRSTRYVILTKITLVHGFILDSLREKLILRYSIPGNKEL